MSSERHLQRVRGVRRRLARDGPPWTRDRADDFETVTVPERDGDALRDLLIAEGVEMGWRALPGAFDAGTTDQATGCPRLRALRLPDPPFEPAFERFQPF